MQPSNIHSLDGLTVGEPSDSGVEHLLLRLHWAFLGSALLVIAPAIGVPLLGSDYVLQPSGVGRLMSPQFAVVFVLLVALVLLYRRGIPALIYNALSCLTLGLSGLTLMEVHWLDLPGWYPTTLTAGAVFGLTLLMSIRKILWPSLEFAAFVLALLSSLFAMGAWTYAEFTKTDLRGWTNFSIWTALVYHILAWSGLSQSRVFLAVLRGDELSRRREWALRSLMYVPLLLLVFGLAVQLLADYQAGYFGHVQATLLLGSVTVFTIYLVFRDTNRIIFLQLQAKQQLQESNQLLEETVQALTQERALVKKANEELNQELDVKAGSLQEAIKALSLQRIKTKAAFEARSRFLSTVSHELRGPLSAVLVLASAIQDRAQDDMRGLAEKLNLATLHLNGLVSDILELNKLEVGKLRLNQAPLELNGHLRRLVEWITPVAAEKGLYLRVISSLPNPCWIVADEMRLRQMMFNLVSNAIKFTSEGGVDIRASSVMEQSGDLSVQLEVLDTGPGIAEERLDSVFQPFEQENNSVASRFGGTGLGLSIVKELAQLMGGRVRVFSLEGIGSCFRIDLTFEPASPPEEVRKPVSPCPAFHRVRHHVRTEGLRNLRVLLVDDIALNLDVGRWVLEAHSCKVLEAKSGHEAIEIVRSEKIDLVLMDLHMPGLNGAETTQAMRDEIDMTQIPVIGLSGSDLEDDLAWCRKSGMYACITKPLDPRKLQEVLLAPAGGTIFGAPVEVSQS